jgi:hypothetical protein
MNRALTMNRVLTMNRALTINRALTTILLFLLCTPLFSQDLSSVFQLTTPSRKPVRSLYKMMAFFDSRQDTTIGTYFSGPDNKSVKLVLKTPIQPQLTKIMNAYTDADAGNGAILFQLKRFSFAEPARTRYCYLSAAIYALKDAGYVKLGSLDTTLVIAAAAEFLSVLAQEGNQVIDDFIAKAIQLPATDGPVYSYDELVHIDSVEKRRIPVYNTTSYTEGLYGTYSSFMNQKPDVKGEVKVKDDGKLSIRIFDSKWVDPKGVTHIFAVVYKGVPYVVTHYGDYPLKKQNDDFYFTGKLRVTPATDGKAGVDVSSGLMGIIPVADKADYRVLLDHRNGEFIHLEVVDTN